MGGALTESRKKVLKTNGHAMFSASSILFLVSLDHGLWPQHRAVCGELNHQIGPWLLCSHCCPPCHAFSKYLNFQLQFRQGRVSPGQHLLQASLTLEEMQEETGRPGCDRGTRTVSTRWVVPCLPYSHHRRELTERALSSQAVTSWCAIASKCTHHPAVADICNSNTGR